MSPLLTLLRKRGGAWNPAAVPGYLGYWGPRGRYTNSGLGTPVSLTDTSTGVGAWKDETVGGTGGVIDGSELTKPVGDGLGGLVLSGSQRLKLPTGVWPNTKTAILIAAPQTTGSGGSVPLAGIISDPFTLGGLCWTLGDKSNSPCNGAQLQHNGGNATTVSSVFAAHAMLDGTVQTEPARPYWITLGAADRMGVGGEEFTYSNNDTVHGNSQARDPAFIGWRLGTWYTNGAVCSVLLSSSVLTDVQIRAAIRGMEADLRNTLDLDPNAIIHGNSWVDGGSNNNPGDEAFRIVPLLKAALPTWQVIDAGTGGITWALLKGTGVGGASLSGYANCYRDSRRRNLLTCIEDQNSYGQLGTAAGVNAARWAYWTAAAALSPYASLGGWDRKLVVCPSWGGFNTNDPAIADWQLIVADVLANYATYGDGLIRQDLLPNIGLKTSVTAPTYWHNENHPSNLGNQEIVQDPTNGMAARLSAAF